MSHSVLKLKSVVEVDFTFPHVFRNLFQRCDYTFSHVFRVPVGSLCHEELGPYFNDRLQRPRSLTRGTHDSIVMSAHAFLVFLGT